MDEFKTIAAIEKLLPKPSRRVLVGLGDDAAVLKSPSGRLIASVDSIVENVHYDSSYFSPQDVGHKALAMNLSDLAAMGALARYALVALSVPRSVQLSWIKRFYAGMSALAQASGIEIVGGNVSSTSGVFQASVTVLGETKRPELRTTAQAGDLLVVSGSLGRAAAGLESLRKKKSWRSLERAQKRPQPKNRLALALNQAKLLSSLIDISDGFASETHHLARSSGVGFEVREEWLPVSKEVRTKAPQQALDWALFGGEDYELLMTIPEGKLVKARKAAKKVGESLTVVGWALPKARGVQWVPAQGRKRKLPNRGWNHLAN